jgi:hypothetical protein
MSEEEEQYNKAALELVDWVEQNANLGPIVGVVLMDICLDFWFKCAGPDKAMEAIDSTVRSKIKELKREELKRENN